MISSRLSYVDSAKFIAIFLVIFGHTGFIRTPCASILYGFHVPLFFVFSGFCIQIVDYQSAIGGGKINKLIKRILVPYFVYALLLGDNPNNFEMLQTILYGSCFTIGQVTGSHLWFLPCYFLSVLLFYATAPLYRNNRFSVLIKILLFSSLAYLTRSEVVTPYFSNGLPWGANAALMGCSLLYMGVFIRLIWQKCPRLIKGTNLKQKYFGVGCMLLLVGVFLLSINASNHPNIAFANYGILPVYLIAIFLMSISLLMISISIDNNIFSYYGRYTFPIYTFHLLIMGVISTVFNKIHLEEYCIDQYLYYLILSICVLTVSCLIIKPLKVYMPNLVGEFK